MDTEGVGFIDAAHQEHVGVPRRGAHADVGHTRMGTSELAIPRCHGHLLSCRLIPTYRRYQSLMVARSRG